MIEKALEKYMSGKRGLVKNKIWFEGFHLKFKTTFLNNEMCSEEVDLEPIFKAYLVHVGLLEEEN